MRIETTHKVIVKWNELTKDKQECIVESWDSDGQLYEYCMQERIATLKAIAKILNGKLDYSLSCVPDRGEFITIKPKDSFYDDELDFEALRDVIDGDCPFTGVCYDDDFIESFNRHRLTPMRSEIDSLNAALNHYIQQIHKEYESMLTVEYIGQECEANDYEFDFETLELV